MARAIVSDIFQIKSRRQIEIELYGGQLPRAANRVNQFDVNLRAVKCGFTFHALEGNIQAIESGFERVGCAVPIFRLAGVILRMHRIPIRKLNGIIIEAEILHHRESEIHAVFHFLFDLRRHAENVRVILSKSANAQQAMQHARTLVAIHRAQFRKPHRQIAITAHLRFVNQNVARTIHGLQLVIGFFDFDGPEHVVFIKIGVPAGVPQIAQHNVRSENQIVTALQLFIAQPVFNNFANQAALGMPENQAGPRLFLNAEEIELGAQLAMIAALGFFQAMQIFVELFF